LEKKNLEKGHSFQESHFCSRLALRLHFDKFYDTSLSHNYQNAQETTNLVTCRVARPDLLRP